MAKVLVIGGGFAGCCAAEMLSAKGYQCTLVERAPFLGGGCKTFYYGGHPYTYGPRHFLTRDEKLYEYLARFLPLRRIGHEQYNYSYVEQDRQFYYYPFHRDDIERMPEKDQIYNELENKGNPGEAKNFEEYVEFSIGNTLYSKLCKNYTSKMWQIDSPTELDAGNGGWQAWSPQGFPLKTGSKAAWEDAISAFPDRPNGYDDYFDAATKDTEVCLETNIEAFDIENYKVKIDGEWHQYDIIISSTSPEHLFHQAFGPLRWVGRDFFKIVLPVPQVFPDDVYFLYYTQDEPFTRIVEYKKFYKNESDQSLIILEIPSSSNKLYPYPTMKDQMHAQKYLDALPEKVFSIGRAGAYRYLDVDDIIQECMDLTDKLES